MDSVGEVGITAFGDVPIGGEFAPHVDGVGECRIGATEGFDRKPAFVTNFMTRPNCFGEIDMAGTWGAAVVFAQMHVLEERRDMFDSRRVGLLLHIGMVGIIHRLDVRMIGQLEQVAQLPHGVAEVALKAVERFRRQHDSGLLGIVAGGVENLSAALIFVGVNVVASEGGERRMKRPAEELSTHIHRAINVPLEQLQSLGPNGGIRAGGVGFGGKHGHTIDLHALILRVGAEPFVGIGVLLAHGDLDAVVADLFETIDMREKVIRNGGRPDEKVEAKLGVKTGGGGVTHGNQEEGLNGSDVGPLTGGGGGQHRIGNAVGFERVAESRCGRLSGCDTLEEVGHLVNERVLETNLHAGDPPLVHVGLVAVTEVNRTPAAKHAFVAVIEILQAMEIVKIPLE